MKNYTESYDNFYKWHRAFIKSVGTSFDHLFCSNKDMTNWFNSVQRNHKSLRNLLGNIRKIKTIKVTKSEDPIDNKLFTKHYNKAFDNDGFTEQLNKAKICDEIMKSPMCLDKYGRKVKVIKYITQNSDIDPNHYILSDLHYMWDLYCSKSKTLQFNLSTSAKAFLLLGHYASDSGSCFNHNGEMCSHKVYLADTPNTFIILGKDEKKNKIIARAWGFTAYNHKIFHIFNRYIKNVNMGTINHGVKLFLQQAVWNNKEEVIMKVRPPSELPSVYDESNIYVNDDDFISFTKAKDKNLLKQEVSYPW